MTKENKYKTNHAVAIPIHLLYQWYLEKYRVELFYDTVQGFIAILWQQNRKITKIYEDAITQLDFNQLRQLTVSSMIRTLKSCYPVVSEYSDGTFALKFFVRGLGGWNNDIHFQQTIEWCRKVGMDNSQALCVARACNGMDSGATDPVCEAASKDAQSWHFNKNSTQDGESNDTRIQHAVECVNFAIDCINSYEFKYKRRGQTIKIKGTQQKNVALLILGEGLHPLQDIFAHTKMFISRYIGHVQGHVFHMEADNPTYLDHANRSPLSLDTEDAKLNYSQRFTNTRLMTLFYLTAYQKRCKISCDELSAKVKEALEIARYTDPGRVYQDELTRYHQFKNSLGIFDRLSFDETNQKLEQLMAESREENTHEEVQHGQSAFYSC